MQSNPMQICYSSPATGYVTEVITASSTQGAINLIKARVPGAKIDGITFLPPQDRRDDGRNSSERRW